MTELVYLTKHSNYELSEVLYNVKQVVIEGLDLQWEAQQSALTMDGATDDFN